MRLVIGVKDTKSCNPRHCSFTLAVTMSPSKPGTVAGVTSRVYLNSSNICSRVTFGSYTDKLARSSKRSFITNAAAASRVSPVSFLKAKPKMAIWELK